MKLDLMKQPRIVYFIFAAIFLFALSYGAYKMKKAAAPAEVPAVAAPAAVAK